MAFFPSETNPTSAPPASRLSQYNEENPIIHEQTVRDTSQGKEEIAKTLGTTASVLSKYAENLGEQESNAMYAQTQAQLDTIKTNAKVDIIKNQGQAALITQKAAETYSSIVQQAVVNKSDRQKLGLTASNDLNDLRIDAARAEFGVHKNLARNEFYSSWPTLLQGIKQNIGNETEYNNRVKSANQYLSSMAIIDALTPTQLGNAYKALHSVIQSAEQYMRAAADNTLTAKDYHRIKGGVISADNGTHMGEPVDHNTLHLYSSQSNDLTKATLEAELAAGGNGNPAAWAELTHSSVASDEMFSFAHGAHTVYSDLKAGVPLTQLANEYKRLEGNIKSTDQKGRFAALKNVLTDAGNGFISKLLANNPIWRDAEYQYNQVSAAIDKSAQSPEQKAELHKTYFNDLIWKRASLMDAMHVPSELQHPLPQDFVEASKAAWANGKDTTPLLVHADQLSQQNKEYLAAEQDTPIHQEVTRIVANTKNGIIAGGLFSGNSRITEGDRSDWIIGNQNNHSFSDLKIKTEVGDQPIMQDIQDKIGDTLRFIANQSGGSNRGVALVQAATNYVKFLAQKNGDFTLNNKDEYVKKATSMINAAYPQMSGVNWKINPNDVPASKSEMDKLASHLIEQKQQEINQRYGTDRGMAMTAANSLTVMSTPTGHLVVVDAYGNKLNEVRYNARMGHYVDHVNNKKEQESQGMITPGNIDLNKREKVKNPDGSYSTVRTITIEQDGKTILLPTIINGKQVSNDEAIAHYKQTGEHMGIFKSEADANKYDERIHKEKGWEGESNKWENPETAEESIDQDLEETKKAREKGKKQAERNKKRFEKERENVRG